MSAAFFAGPFRVNVIFDQPIKDHFLDPANWAGRTGPGLNNLFIGRGPATITYRRVSMLCDLVGPAFGAGRVTYLANPPDVTNRFLQPAPAFLNFPF